MTKPFTPDEDAKLRAEMDRKTPVRQIAEMLRRSRPNVYARIEALGLPLHAPNLSNRVPHQRQADEFSPLAGEHPRPAEDGDFIGALTAAGGYPYPRTLKSGLTVLVTHDGRPHPLAFQRAA